jgi:hypothetical protein
MTMGDVYLRHGQLSKALIFWKNARVLLERSLQARAVAEIVPLLEVEIWHQTCFGGVKLISHQDARGKAEASQ